MKLLPETYVKSALYGNYYFLQDSLFMCCAINADGEPDTDNIRPVDFSSIKDDDDYDSIWTIVYFLEEITE